ncbi:MAG: hypothetical protein WB760_12915, partial [Xanthobacteraceae bacterium]
MIDWQSLTARAGRAENVQAPQEAIRTSDIHKQLERICASTAFRGSLRLTRFLTFVVETTLAGKSDTIKAYTIAVGALDRGGDFNPESDPIVRVEAGRLRRALAQYYAGAGRNDPVVIDLPRGTYVPVFHRVGADNDDAPAPAPHELEKMPGNPEDAPSPGISPSAEQADLVWLSRQPEQALAQRQAATGKSETRAAVASASWRMRAAPMVRIGLYAVAALAVLQVLFDIDRPLTGGENQGLFFKLWPIRNTAAVQSPAFAREPIVDVEPVKAVGQPAPDAMAPWMIRERLFDALARYDGVAVVPDPPHPPGSLPGAPSEADDRPPPPYYRLSSAINYFPDGNFTIAMRLIDTADGTIAWANAFDREPEPIRHSGSISRNVAQALLQQFGVIQAREASKRATADPMQDSYRCILDANAYLRSFDPSLHDPARDCLERATADSHPLVGV